MGLDELADQAASAVDALCGRGSHGSCWPLPDLLLLRHVRPTAPEATLYEPVVCLILQGRKETTVGGLTRRLRSGDSMIISHDLPVVSRISSASSNHPYLALVFVIDMALLRGLAAEIDDAVAGDEAAQSLAVHSSEPALVDVLSRYLAVSKDPVEARILGPTIRREVHFRLLTATHGGMLRQLQQRNHHANAIAKAIAFVRKNYRSTIAIPELANVACMSTSALHKHFKTVTSTTPLQYQKELRLLEARRLLLAGQNSITSAAFEVGYQSPSQFSREYSRKFGTSPRSDLVS